MSANATAARPDGPPPSDGGTDALVGTVINGKFRVQAVIGKGGMGKVYRAEQLPLGRAVALKVLHARASHEEVDPQFQRRFFLEASLCAKLSHPNVVTIFDYGRIENADSESYFMAMEYLEGQTLFSRLRSLPFHRLDPADAIRIALEVARGLREAHRHGVVHRDLKPANVMLVPDAESGEKVKILDFGLVKQVESDNREDLTQQGAFLGSPKYMAPEQIEGSQVDSRTDLYALGVILYQSLTGKVPFDAPTSMHILLAHVNNPVPPLRQMNPLLEVSASLEALVMQLLAKKPDERPPNADAVVRALRGVQHEMGLAPAEVAQTGFRTRTGTLAAGSIGEAGTSGVGNATGTFSGVASVYPPSIGSTSGIERHTTSSISRGNTSGTGSISGGGARGALNATGSGVLPAAEAPASSKTGLVVALVGVLVVMIALGMFFGLRSSQGGGAAVATAAPTASASAARPSLPRLVLESTPAGASVSEGGRVLGTTPLEIPLESDQSNAREFTLTLAGYTTASVRQEPTHETVRRAVVLAPSIGATATAEPTSTAANGEGPRRPGNGGGRPPRRDPVARPSASTGSGGGDLDIQMHR